ncbi:MAG: MotA/TolQ/ExbB proton channel family protein [Alphaproteobacteria bacterium]|nr:MotA/TolQ/ExbB proton channel family protein [Alphaproteobacteria bacterium]
MASDAAQDQAAAAQHEEDHATSALPMPQISLPAPKTKLDLATLLGVIGSVALIAGAISMSESDASFINLPSILIVILGTMAATSISFTGDELIKAWRVVRKSMVRRVYNPSSLAKNLIALAIVARKKGILALSTYERDLRRDPFLARAMQLVVDGYQAPDIQRLLGQEIESLVERHKRSASITLRAAEIAPAMGLIGTLVGLVQMLADLENPETIGPAMAVALLTTFYGAILGNVIMAPLAMKLEKNSKDEAMVKTLISIAAISMANQENPRRLEMLLNSELPPSERINYFDK